jgi:hypothetical protein
MNAMKEFIGLFPSFEAIPEMVTCARIEHMFSYAEDGRVFILKFGYSPTDLDEFLRSLDFDYDDGYGTQELFGTIWLNYGSWYERTEYDGAEGWSRKSRPMIPDDCFTEELNTDQ